TGSNAGQARFSALWRLPIGEVICATPASDLEILLAQPTPDGAHRPEHRRVTVPAGCADGDLSRVLFRRASAGNGAETCHPKPGVAGQAFASVLRPKD